MTQIDLKNHPNVGKKILYKPVIMADTDECPIDCVQDEFDYWDSDLLG